MTTAEKTCFKCGKAQPLAGFYRHPKMADGHLNKCKECTKKDAFISRHILHRERTLAYDRQRGNRQKPQYMKEYRKRFPEKYAATSAVNNALRSGKLRKLPCWTCGTMERVHAHHADYSQPLDVVWLCTEHHQQLHYSL